MERVFKDFTYHLECSHSGLSTKAFELGGGIEDEHISMERLQVFPLVRGKNAVHF